MVLCMRTTVDIPDSLMVRLKRALSDRKTTFRSLVISALEQTLEEKEPVGPFRLRDASTGKANGRTVSNEAINQAIDENRGQSF